MRIFLIVCLLAFAMLVEADDAGIALGSGDFSTAAKLYEEGLAENGPNAAMLYNLGNARYRLGEFGPAILAYERALLLDPRASDIRTNLALARDAAAAFEEIDPPVWEAPLFWLGFDEWLIVGAASLVLLAVVSLVKGFGFPKRKSRILRILAVVAITFLFVSVAAVSLRRSELDRAIVLSPDAAVRLSPFSTAEVVATLQAGRPVQVEKEHEGFYRIANGWISREDAEKVYLEKD